MAIPATTLSGKENWWEKHVAVDSLLECFAISNVQYKRRNLLADSEQETIGSDTWTWLAMCIAGNIFLMLSQTYHTFSPQNKHSNWGTDYFRTLSLDLWKCNISFWSWLEGVQTAETFGQLCSWSRMGKGPLWYFQQWLTNFLWLADFVVPSFVCCNPEFVEWTPGAAVVLLFSDFVPFCLHRSSWWEVPVAAVFSSFACPIGSLVHGLWSDDFPWVGWDFQNDCLLSAALTAFNFPSMPSVDSTRVLDWLKLLLLPHTIKDNAKVLLSILRLALKNEFLQFPLEYSLGTWFPSNSSGNTSSENDFVRFPSI